MSYTAERCIASKTRGTIIDLFEDGRTRIYGKTLDDCRAEAGYEDAEEMSVDEFIAWKADQQDAVPITWEPTTPQRYDDALSALPPVAWRAHGFLLGEPWDHHARTGAPRYQAYRKLGEQFFVSSRPITVAEWKAV